ncbi:MAG: uroporphyrinogen-III C-methyltransferase [Acidiferrobacterales bacterium]
MTNKDPDVRTPAAGATEPPTPNTSHRRRPRSVSGGLALILAIVALLASAYLGYTLIAKRGLYSASMSSGLEHLAEQNAKSQGAIATLTEQLEALKKNQDALQAALAKVSSEFGKGRRQWLLAESVQLMVIANHRLQLSHNVDLALAALRAADQDLRQLADPRYLPVRRLLAGEIVRLESLGHVDVSGMALRLGDIAQHVDSLPLTPVSHVVAGPATAQTVQHSQFGSMWHDLIGLVRIRRTSKLRVPLLPPDEEYFLRQNLRLMLYGAQTALLQGNAAVFGQDVTTARQWIRNYYDTSAAPVQADEAELRRMLNSPVRSKLPDISGSLEQLRRIRRSEAAP